MKDLNYSLTSSDYTWKNALLWGNFSGHCRKAMYGTFAERFVHILIAVAEILPVFSQITSIFEKFIVEKFKQPDFKTNLSKRKILFINSKSLEEHVNKRISSQESKNAPASKETQPIVNDNDHIINDLKNEPTHPGPSLDVPMNYVNSEIIKSSPAMESESKLAGIETAQQVSDEQEIPIVNNEIANSSEGEDNNFKDAVIKIQSFVRSNLARVKAIEIKEHYLNLELFKKATYYTNKTANLRGEPRAVNGIAMVYLPRDIPIVLKCIGDSLSQRRFKKILQARKICQKNSYKDLVVPRARVHGDFLLESRLPIMVHDFREQVGLYVDNRDKFTSAIREFAGFLFQTTLHDIVGRPEIFYTKLTDTEIGRYDNVALYLEETEGKIGLVDLEQFDPNCDKTDDRWCYSRCETLICLFPLHFDEILNVAKEYDPTIDNFREDLEKIRDKACSFFKMIYIDHDEFIKHHHITIENSTRIVEIKPENYLNIHEEIRLFIHNSHQGHYGSDSQNCLGVDPKDTLIQLEKKFPEVIQATTNFLSKMIRLSLMQRSAKQSHISERDLIFFRAINFSNQHPECTALKKIIKSKFEMLELDYFEFIKVIFLSLVKEKVLASCKVDLKDEKIFICC